MTLARTLLTFLVCLAGSLGLHSDARAQPMGKTLIVPFGVGAQSASQEASSTEAALQKERVPLLSLHEAHDRFLARSRVAQSPAPRDIDELAREASAAIQHVAMGHTRAAQESVKRIVSLAERSLETLNRETATARGLLDACLALVRASLHEGKRDDAIDQAMRCRRLVPDLAPSDVAHPANVVGALAEADDQLRRMRVGSLNVETRPARSCEVYLNGRHLGHTPFALGRAPAGAYRVQVECEGEGDGRVHWVDLGDDPVLLTVDTSFDRAIATEPRLTLHYANDDDARATLVSHAAELGREVRAEDVVLIGRLGAKLVALRVLTKQQQLVGGVALPDSAPTSLRKAAERLTRAEFDAVDPSAFQPRPAPVAGTSADLAPEQLPKGRPAQPAPVAAPPQAAPKEHPSEGSARVLVGLGGALAGLGAAGLATGFGLQAHAVTLRHRAERGEIGSDSQQRAQTKYDDFRLVPLAGVAGSALLTAAVPMLLPSHPPRSAAAWVGGALGGAAGLAAAIVGGILTRREPVLGGLLISAGVPLITIPITQLARAAR